MAKSIGSNFVQGLLDELNRLSTVTETFKLPTLGKLDGIQPEVTLRMMTTYEEKIRTGSKSSFWRTMGNIINNCMVEPTGIDSYKLTAIDFIFLMYKLRIISYGKDYKVNLSFCPFCKKSLKDVSVDLDKLEVTYISDEFREPFPVKLPKSGWDIECRLLRMNELDELQAEADKILADFPSYEGDPMTPLRLSRQIVSIKGQKLNRIQIQSIIDKLPAIDENAISRAFEKIDIGMNLNAEYTCPNCDQKIIIPLAITEEFFRPTSD